jgi:2-polyprenyl-6-methoxyphenol hydroxylase-like FAD-dependent oxidoreductase
VALEVTVLRATCCIAGGGPAGMMLGFLLARAGVDVVVLEKHADFLRDFRGDTVHPSTLELIYELGLLDEFLSRSHRKVSHLSVNISGETLDFADFSHVPAHCKFIALMPQWDFLDFLADHGREYVGFDLRMQAEVTDVIVENDRVVGVRAHTPEGPLEVRADLVVGADGRGSIVRDKARLSVQDLGAPMDVLWFSLSRRDSDPQGVLGCFDSGRLIAMIDRGDYWQCGYVIAKGTMESVREKGLSLLQADLSRLAPFLADRVGELQSWDQVKLLTVKVDRLRRWYRPGLLCIGDAAHAMSPAGGVGINLAVQDAVAAANLLADSLRQHRTRERDLARVQRRRQFPTRVTQRLQVIMQERIISRVLDDTGGLRVPTMLRLFQRCPWLRRLPARLVGIGVRPEHVRTPATPKRMPSPGAP